MLLGKMERIHTLKEIRGISNQVNSAEDLDGVDTNGNLCSSPVDLLEAVEVGSSSFHLDFQSISLDNHGQGWLDIHSLGSELLQ